MAKRFIGVAVFGLMGGWICWGGEGWRPELDGYARMRNYVDLAESDVREHVYEWRVEWPWRISETLAGRWSGDARIWSGARGDGGAFETEREAALWEGYIEVDRYPFTMRAGKQFLRWGKGDEVNPVDNFTPEDLREALNLDRAERKIPAVAVYPKYYFSEWVSLEGYYQPVFEPNRVGESEERWEPYVRRAYRSMGFAFREERGPDETFRDGVWAGRLLAKGETGDLSVSYADHFEQNPSYAVRRNPLFRPGGTEPPAHVDTVWPRVRSVGTDFETAYEGWGFREETVFAMGRPYVTKNPADDDALVEKDAIENLLGLDYTYRNDTYINAQLIQEFVLGHERGMTTDAYEASVTFRVWRYFLRQKAKAQVTGRHYLTRRDSYWKVNAEYELSESLKFDGGVMFFDGEDEGLFGQFSGNDQAYVTVRFSY